MFDFLIVVLCVLPVGGPFAAVLRLALPLHLRQPGTRQGRDRAAYPNWIRGADGQKVVTDVGYFPLPENLRAK